MKKNFGIVIAVCLVILYVAIRSFTVDITHDEAYSFYNVKHFWYVESLCTANTHWLNSITIKIALLFGSESNWAIRWFSTVSAIAFFTVCYFFIRSLNNIYQKLFACTLLLFNLYVLDYFGLARGYASGLMFEGMALLLFIQSLRQQQRKLEYLQGLLKGKHTIYELLEHKFTFFVHTDKPGILYESEHNMRLWPRIADGQPVLYTEEEIETLKKQPNLTCILMNFGKDNADLYNEKLAKALQEYNEKPSS